MKKSLLLAGFSSLAALLFCEAALRLVGPVTLPALPKPSSTASFVARFPTQQGTDRQWFAEDPPALTNRRAVAPELRARYDDFNRRGLYGPQSAYLWNRAYLQQKICAPLSVFANYPETVLAFEPPRQSIHPIYRFPPSSTLPSGLVTNQFGLRGPEITLAKPPKTIRIAFVGASTTINNHSYPFSYPERTVHWLNRFAEASHYDVHFEVLNAGREGINSEDIAPIVRDELMPLDPDAVVYYEGSNQFGAASNLVVPRVSPRAKVPASEEAPVHWLPPSIREHSRLGDLADRSVSRFVGLSEPRKPAYRLSWPEGVVPGNPDISRSNLPLNLTTILRDLDRIRQALQPTGGQLVLCSFEWLAKDGMKFSTASQVFVYEQLNTVLWPLRYADIARLRDFQNLVFRRYAESRGIPFLDVAGQMPQDPNLFVDAIHMTDDGERVKAWIVFQQLVPIIRKQIESGRLPRQTSRSELPAMPSLAATAARVGCDTRAFALKFRIDGLLPLASIQLAYNKARIERGHPLSITTSSEPASFAATLPIDVAKNLEGPRSVYLRARVLRGHIGLGVLDRDGDFQIEIRADPSPDMTDVYVPVPDPEGAVALIIRNQALGDTSSTILVEDTALMAAKPLPAAR